MGESRFSFFKSIFSNLLYDGPNSMELLKPRGDGTGRDQYFCFFFFFKKNRRHKKRQIFNFILLTSFFGRSTRSTFFFLPFLHFFQLEHRAFVFLLNMIQQTNILFPPDTRRRVSLDGPLADVDRLAAGSVPVIRSFFF